ncbi:CPBP family intramembrane glutamic endopeptidase [Amycolatopsis tolypomycina]|uniref:CPBP family intramembrane glutamic endopeptidase n=1 Tax=Amycolatopsis tolypomycina TaxID=208445 RepID=UPI0033A23A27
MGKAASAKGSAVATRVDIEERTGGGGGLRDSIRRRPLTWFFVLANLLSWVAWTPYILSENGLDVLHFRFPELLGTAQFAGVLPGAYLGPIGAAFLVTAIADGRTGLRRWAGRLFRWRVSWLWYVGVVLSVPALLTLTTMALSEQNPVVPAVATLVAYLPGLVLQMVTTGLAEEPGWRDFALPRLQQRYGPLGGTLILGPLWGVWHLPLFFSEWGGWPDVTWLTVLEFVATCVTFSIIMTWVFNRTGQSLPLAMLLHVSVNNFFSIAWAEMFPSLTVRDTTHAFLLASTAVALVLLVATRGRLGYRPKTRDLAG